MENEAKVLTPCELHTWVMHLDLIRASDNLSVIRPQFFPRQVQSLSPKAGTNTMAETQFPWDELIELIIRDQLVVPILGSELCTISGENGATFEEIAARRLAAKSGLQLQGNISLARLAQDLMNQGRPKAQLCRELGEIQRELLEQEGSTPEPLRHFAEIRDFPLIVTTNTDGFLAAAIREARERDAGPVAAALGANVDLPRNWAQGPKPTLFHLLGRIAPVPNFALTEEDSLEFLHRMQSEAHRPEQLFDELRSRHLLLVGVRFTNWLMRFFLRILHGARLSEDTGQVIVLAADVVRRDAGLLGFLRESSRRIWIYEEGTALDFMAELRRRWHTAHDEPWATTAEGDAPPEPDPMPNGAVFVSCSRADRPAAQRLAAVLDEAGLDTWFDRNEKPTGSRYETRVRQYIQRCDLFVPLISPQTESQGDGFFRREWEWALERLETLEGGTRFVLPATLEEGLAPTQVPPTFRKLPLGAAPGGMPSPDFLRECIAAVRQLRASRNS